MVLIRLEYIEAAEHEFIFLLHQFIEELHIIRVIVEVIAGQGIHKLKKLVLFAWERGLGSFDIGAQLLCEADQVEAQFTIAYSFGKEAIDNAEYLEVFLKNKSFQEGCSLLVVQ